MAADHPEDPFGLARFVAAQDDGGTFDRAVAELRRGRKQSHWMWFVFPQLAGLGKSETARRYAIASLEEARAYLSHPVLGPRLAACARVVADLPSRDPEALLGTLDALKLRSSMTLFHRAEPEEPVFALVLERCFEGRLDPLTEARLAEADRHGPDEG